MKIKMVTLVKNILTLPMQSYGKNIMFHKTFLFIFLISLVGELLYRLFLLYNFHPEERKYVISH